MNQQFAISASNLIGPEPRCREYTLLGVFSFSDDGSHQEFVLGFPNISESDLRQRLAQAIPKWTEIWVNKMLEKFPTYQIKKEDLTEDDVRWLYGQFDTVAERGLIPEVQMDKLRSALAEIVPPPKKAALPAADRVDKLKTLAELRSSGALTQEEFEAEKARLLSS
jgi:hypothetical protein